MHLVAKKFGRKSNRALFQNITSFSGISFFVKIKIILGIIFLILYFYDFIIWVWKVHQVALVSNTGVGEWGDWRIGLDLKLHLLRGVLAL